MRKVTLLVIFIITISTLCSADTINVPLDQPTIQDAINAAVHGDVVLVAPGTYLENINFQGKAIDVKSSHGPVRTTIDGGNPVDPDLGSVVSFTQGEDNDSVLDGFTLTNGTGTLNYQEFHGGGIYCVDSSPLITNNIIIANTYISGNGGGICCYQSDAIIRNNTIKDNNDSNGGAGIYCAVSQAVITENTIVSNFSHGSGGGIGCLNSTLTISKNTIAQNYGGCSGGGISCNFSGSVIIDNVIEANETDGFANGGGISCYHSSPLIMNNLIKGNTANWPYCRAGGIYSAESTSLILNNRIIENSSAYDWGGGVYDGFGGGIYISQDDGTVIGNNHIIGNLGGECGGVYCSGKATITGNTISDNCALSDWQSGGGGLFCSTAGETEVTNNIISNNVSESGGGGVVVEKSDPVLFANNRIYNNHAMSGGGMAIYNNVGMTFLNNTVTNNTADNLGGAFFCSYSSVMDISNSILWNNTDGAGYQIVVPGSSNPSTVTFSYSDIEGGESAILVEPPSTYEWGAGIIEAEPMFVDDENGDLHLTNFSPCLEAGDSLAPGLCGVDMEGDPRIAGGFVDIGADEFHTHLYCTGDFTPQGAIEGKFVGLPGAWHVYLFIGSGVMNPPIQHKWGTFYLESPWLAIPLAPIPSNGILTVPETIPVLPAAPYDIPMQALIGWELSNLFVVEVRT